MQKFGTALLFAGVSAASAQSPSERTAFIRGLTDNTLGNAMTMQFDRFCGDEFCAFRVMTEIGGLTVLVDSGSSSLGFCLPYDANDVTNVQRATTESGQPVSQCALYGGSSEYAHGWTGPSYFGDVKGPNDQILEQVLFSTMSHAVGLSGNACGKPSTSSVGVSTPLGGIWGIAGTSLNSAGVMTNNLDETWMGIPSNSQCDVLNGQCQCPSETVNVPDTLLQTIARSFGSSNADQWGLYWDGKLGPNSGKMFFGDQADIVSTSPYATTYIPITSDGFYGFTVSAVQVNSKYISAGAFETIYDTGTPAFVLPTNLYNQLNELVTDEGITISLVLKTTSKSSFKVKMFVNSEIFQSDFEAGSTSILGLPLMRYVEYVKVNVAEQTMQMVPRSVDGFILTPLN